MPTYSIQLNVNVPGLGDRTFVTANVVRPTIEEAIAAAKAGIVVTTLQALQTAP